MIVFEGVEVQVQDGPTVLCDVNLTLCERRVAVIGSNGSGKTSLARCVNGLTLPTRGTVSVEGLDTVRDRAAVQRRVGFVFQDADHQLVAPTPLEDVVLGLRAAGHSKGSARETALAALTDHGLEEKASQAIHTLSGGEKHLVALIGVLVLEPAWLVVDEPTTTLDLVNRRRVVDALMNLSPNLLLVSHDLELVGACDRAVWMVDGAVAGDGEPREVVAAYRSAVERP